MRRDLVTSVLAILAVTVVFGLAYPLVVTGISQVAFPGRADGSLIHRDGKVVGSRLLAQDFRKPVLGANGKPKTDKDGNPILTPDPVLPPAPVHGHQLQRRRVSLHEPRAQQQDRRVTRSRPRWPPT